MAKDEGGSTLVGMGEKVDCGGRRWMTVDGGGSQAEGDGRFGQKEPKEWLKKRLFGTLGGGDCDAGGSQAEEIEEGVRSGEELDKCVEATASTKASGRRRGDTLRKERRPGAMGEDVFSRKEEKCSLGFYTNSNLKN
nr:hypothetical protein Iba_chr03aCG9960 [Ipomoea batatas]